MRLLPGVPEAIALLRGVGYEVFVVTNQRGVAKGLLTEDELQLIHQRMCQQLGAAGAAITKVYYCPHEKQPPCSCRKPAPGMLLTAAQAFDIDLASSWMMGYSDIDVKAGKSAAGKPVRIAPRDPRVNTHANRTPQSIPCA